MLSINLSNNLSESILRANNIVLAPPPVAYRVLGFAAIAALRMVFATTAGSEV